jgi:threonylcarbamoyladenosine tRNA methylthiotransferase MtaB
MKQLPNVAWVVSNAEKARMADLVSPPEPLTAPSIEQEPILAHLGPGALGRTRAFVKVQDGCDNRCTFCVTTLARGPGRSRSEGEIVREAQKLLEAGYQELVLSGVHLGSYGRDRASGDGLYRLVETLLRETEVPRLRLSSLEPWDLSPDFFDLWSDPRLCRQLHLPLQSGCDDVLRRMARHTTRSSFAALVAAARACIPDLALTTDIIVGFPGESDDAFRESYCFVEEMAFARLHVFPYSPRPGTAAARMPDQVPAETKATRSRIMRLLGEQQARSYQRQFVGQTLPVLWEIAKENGVWRGLTDNYMTVITSCGANLANRITPTYLVEAVDQGLRGEVNLASVI